ncbi:class I tRNA ligase family protein [bacterium]|nr:class I tRNA ligase family protein [bacterium]
MSFPQINSRQSFAALELETLAYWKANNTFQKSLEIREGAPEFNFYDGPPFATGTPHYGHLLAGTIKDVIPRYQTMQGKFVERRFGWDCHGLPIENIVEKKLGISGKKDIEDKVGVFEFNEQCRANVFGYTDVWRQTVERMGRWVDMDNDYKTMDTDFMESVWWVFKSIYDKGYVYESYRVVPYCPRCSTPLSNFEVNQGYEDKQDKAVTVKFKVKNEENTYILAWTTTPWTLPANLGLAVKKDFDYVKAKVFSGKWDKF